MEEGFQWRGDEEGSVLQAAIARCDYEIGRCMTEHGDWGLLLGLVDWLAEKEVLMTELDKVDMINHPLHYIRGKIEVADFILDQGLTWCLGNAIKYICRAGYRPDADPIEDLKKGIWYMEREIREREKTK